MIKKVAITGSVEWEDRIKIKDTLFKLKKKFKDIEVTGGGLKNGVDPIVRKCCLEFEMEFSEKPPYNQPWTPHCSEPSYLYNKPYNSKYIYIRNAKLAKESDMLILFKLPGDESPQLLALIENFSKLNKKILIIN